MQFSFCLVPLYLNHVLKFQKYLHSSFNAVILRFFLLFGKFSERKKLLYFVVGAVPDRGLFPPRMGSQRENRSGGIQRI